MLPQLAHWLGFRHHGVTSPRRPTAREELLDLVTRSRREELEEENRAHRPERRLSILLSWLGSWLRPPRPPANVGLPEVARSELAITFIGHASALLRYRGLSIVCDPMLSTRLRLVRRAVEAGVGPDELRDVELILLTHAHPGHLDRRSLAQLPRTATIVAPPHTAAHVSSLGFARVVELGIGHSIELLGAEIIATPVRHAARGLGVCAFVIRGPGPSVYFCGDSGYFAGFAEVGRRFCPDVALLPIGGYLPGSFRDRHLSPPEALAAFEDLGARMLIPIHYGAFPLSYESLDDPLNWLADLVDDRGIAPWVTILDPGQSVRLAATPPGL